MGYQGDELKKVPEGLSFSTIYAVIVSGDPPNPCGHALLYVPFQKDLAISGGYYFQIAGVYKYPHIMDENGFNRYVAENDKKVLHFYSVRLKDPVGAKKRLEELVGEKWFWAVLPNNCAAFVEDIADAGGSNAGLWSNCPSGEAFERPFYETAPEAINREIDKGFKMLDSYLRRGIPR